MKLLFIGDIVGQPGRKAVKEILPTLKEKEKFDLVIANGENLSHGKGMTLKTISEMISAGIDFFTSGNHVWKQKEIFAKLDTKEFPVIRPANYPPMVHGKGYQIIKTSMLKKVLVINLIGRVFFPQQYDCPFRAADQILKETEYENPEAILVDIHAEATSEKIALKHYLDGKISAIVGTHTHVATADAQISELGTAYITDVGMCGLKDSIIGFDKKNIIKQFLTQLPVTHEIGEGKAIFNAVMLEISSHKKALNIRQILQEVA